MRTGITLKGLGLLCCLSFVFGSVGTAIAQNNAKMTKRGFKFGNMHYWRAGAQNVKLGSYGKKRPTYGIEVHKDMNAKSFGKKVTVSDVYKIDWSKDSKFMLNAGVKYVGMGAKGAFSRTASKKAKLALVLMNIHGGDLADVINKKANKKVLNYLKANNNARVVGSVWVVMEAQLADSISNAGSLSATGTTPNGINIEAGLGGGSKEKSSISIPKKAVFAYMLYKVSKWKKKRATKKVKRKGKKKGYKKVKLLHKKKFKVLQMADDQVGAR